MPAFDALTRDFGGRPFALLAISVDRGGLKKPRRFFDDVGIRDLTLYGDEDGRLAPKHFQRSQREWLDLAGRERP
jgi:hypothetical protein